MCGYVCVVDIRRGRHVPLRLVRLERFPRPLDVPRLERFTGQIPRDVHVFQLGHRLFGEEAPFGQIENIMTRSNFSHAHPIILVRRRRVHVDPRPRVVAV